MLKIKSLIPTTMEQPISQPMFAGGKCEYNKRENMHKLRLQNSLLLDKILNASTTVVQFIT